MPAIILCGFARGTPRMEPVAIVVFAVLMGLASLQLLISSVQDILSRVSSGPTALAIDTLTWCVLGIVIGVKVALFVACAPFRTSSSTIRALAQVKHSQAHMHTCTLAYMHICTHKNTCTRIHM